MGPNRKALIIWGCVILALIWVGVIIAINFHGSYVTIQDSPGSSHTEYQHSRIGEATIVGLLFTGIMATILILGQDLD